MPIPRKIIASLISPFAILLPILVASLWEANQPLLMINGEADDAPMRAMGLFVIALPIVYIFLVFLSHAVGIIILRLKLVSLPNFVGAAVALAVLLSVPVGIALSNPRRFGATDTLATIGVVMFSFVVCALPGALCWWHLAGGEKYSSGLVAESQNAN